jgi:hypothetical protein
MIEEAIVYMQLHKPKAAVLLSRRRKNDLKAGPYLYK